jgi:hypothetical protein
MLQKGMREFIFGGIVFKGLTLVRQVLYHLSQEPSSFFVLIIFQVRSHIFAWAWP